MRVCYLQILIDGIVLLNLVEGNAVEWQRASDVLKVKQTDESNYIIK